MIDVVTVFIAVAINNIRKFFTKTLTFSLSIANSFAIISSKIVLLNEIIIYNFDNNEMMWNL